MDLTYMGRNKKYFTKEEELCARNAARKRCVEKKLGKYLKFCPVCKITMTYSSPYELNRNIKKNTKCKSCSAKNKIFSEEHRKNLSRANLGKKLSLERKEHLSKIHTGKKHSKETREKISIGNKGKKYSPESILKMRVSAINRIFQNSGQCSPRYNPRACKIIEEYGKEHGYNFQHAENGGEFYIKELGYWVDGYDKEKNVVIEHYERAHSRQEEKDILRENEIKEFLGCRFIILKEK